MKHFQHLFVCIMLFFASSQLSAQSCNTAASVTSDIWNKTTSLLAQTYACPVAQIISGQPLPNCVRNVRTYAGFANKMIRFWNSNAGNSWSTIGPRKLEMGKSHQGRLVGTTGRLYISPCPVNKNSVSITLEELDGKAKTGVKICKVNHRNQAVTVRTIWFNDSSSKKRNKKEKYTVNIPGASGFIMKVNLDAKSVGNTFQYKVRMN